MCNCKKRNHGCMDCQHYHHSETVLDGYNVENFGSMIIKTPKYKDVPAHCDYDNEKFLAWWEENKFKPITEVEAPEECFELSESLKPLEDMISLANEILSKIKK